MKGFAANEDPLKLLEEREAIHLLLPQTTSEKIHKNYAAFTINPSTRYPNLSGLVPLGEVANLYDNGTGPINCIPRTGPVVSKVEKRSAAQTEAINRKRSKDDLMVNDRSEPVHEPRDASKKPRVIDALTKSKDTPTNTSNVEPHSPKSKSKNKNPKSEGRSLFHPALKPKPTITSDDMHVHKITHKKKASKQLPMDDSVVLLSHTKVASKDKVSTGSSSSSKAQRKTAGHKDKPVVPADKPILPSSSHMATPPVDSCPASHGRDRSPPHNEINVLRMRATFEQRDQDAKNTAFLRQRISRRSAAGETETSVIRVPKSASISDLQDPQLSTASSAFPSSNPQPIKHHKSKYPSTSKKHQITPPKGNSTSAKDHKGPVAPKQTEKSSFMKWVKEPHKQVAAMVASIMHSDSYRPREQTDCGTDETASYKPLPEETYMSTTLPDTLSSDEHHLICPDDEEAEPTADEMLLSPDEDVTENSIDQEIVLDVSKESSHEKQDVSVEYGAFTSQESPATEDQVGIQEEDTMKGDIEALDDVRVQPLIAKLEPTTVN